jgi:hypothetical protein
VLEDRVTGDCDATGGDGFADVNPMVMLLGGGA